MKFPRTRRFDYTHEKIMNSIHGYDTIRTNLFPTLPARILARVVVMVFVASIVACSPTVATRGNIPSEIKLSQITIGVHKRNDVRSILGVPSTLGTFEDNIWYYIGHTTTQFAFFREKIIEQKIVAIVFNNQGVVEQRKVLDKDALREISLNERITPTAGHSLGFLEQILGNIGRFNN